MYPGMLLGFTVSYRSSAMGCTGLGRVKKIRIYIVGISWERQILILVKAPHS